MKNRLFWGLIATLMLLVGISTGASAAGEPDRAGFTAADSEFYLTDDLFFYYRPGLVLTVTDYDIPSDRHPVVTFTLTDPGGLPLDINGVLTPGDVDVRYFITYIPVGEEQIVNYIVGSRGPTRDSGGTLTTIEVGTYTYTYGVELPADYEVDATHTIAVAGRRDLRDFFGLDRYADDDVVNFVPSGASDPMPRDVVTADTCNRCHNPMSNHGGRYLQIATCEQCHNPGLVDDDGISYSMDVVIHREHALMDEYPVLPEESWYDCSACHTGGTTTDDLLMVANPNPAEACNANGLSMTEIFWGDSGIEVHINSADGKLFAAASAPGSAETGQWVKDGMVFVLVDSATGEVIQEVPVDNTVLGCATNPPGTYRGTAATQWDRWTSRPSRDVCGSCHLDIDFENGVGHFTQTNDDMCATCHVPFTGTEFDASVTGAHTVVYKSNQLPGIQLDFVSVTNVGPNLQPIVTFNVSDKFGPVNPNTMGRLRLSLSGPNDDFDFYVQENVLGKARQSDTGWTYKFAAKLPADASGSFTVGAEGRTPETLETGGGETFSHNDQMQNPTFAFAVTDDEADARRLVVDDAKCENCHANLSLHGENRHDANTYCQTCHMPDATDAIVRPEIDNPPESIHFKYMIHKIHMGEELENGIVYYGYMGSVNDFSDVEFPGELSDCESCHDGDTYNIPLPAGVLPTNSPNTPITTMLPVTASCLSCHDSNDAAAHADANTSSNLGESCATCHGEDKTYSVERVHAR
ncbi:OmcA/MtrC family decaheme c-type cytochrome [Pseudomonadota bacterium]